MKLLFDECVPRKVKFLFADGGHECETVPDAGFSGKENGELLALAEGHFDVLVTIDRNIRYQQNMTGRNIAILIIRAASNDLDDIRPHVPKMLWLANCYGRADFTGNRAAQVNWLSLSEPIRWQ
jgi:predicted nuclease of predicted toxin-antitoxin system